MSGNGGAPPVLAKILRAEFLIDCESYTKVDGLPIFTRDVMEQILARV